MAAWLRFILSLISSFDVQADGKRIEIIAKLSDRSEEDQKLSVQMEHFVFPELDKILREIPEVAEALKVKNRMASGKDEVDILFCNDGGGRHLVSAEIDVEGLSISNVSRYLEMRRQEALKCFEHAQESFVQR